MSWVVENPSSPSKRLGLAAITLKKTRAMAASPSLFDGLLGETPCCFKFAADRNDDKLERRAHHKHRRIRTAQLYLRTNRRTAAKQ